MLPTSDVCCAPQNCLVQGNFVVHHMWLTSLAPTPTGWTSRRDMLLRRFGNMVGQPVSAVLNAALVKKSLLLQLGGFVFYGNATPADPSSKPGLTFQGVRGDHVAFGGEGKVSRVCRGGVRVCRWKDRWVHPLLPNKRASITFVAHVGVVYDCQLDVHCTLHTVGHPAFMVARLCSCHACSAAAMRQPSPRALCAMQCCRRAATAWTR